MASRRMIALGGGSGTVSFPVVAPNGSVGAPSISVGGANTGFYSVLANTIQIAQNGILRMSITSTDIGIFNDSAASVFDVTPSSGVLRLASTGSFALTSGPATNSPDTAISRLGAASIAIGSGTVGDITGSLTLASITQQTPNGAQWISGQNSELLTLSTVGTTTDTVGNLLPANSLIESVVARVTTTITTATSWALGDGTTAARFAAANSTMTAGATSVGTAHWAGTISSVQAAAAKVRVTTVGTPGAGVVRITVFYSQLVAPTS